MAQATKLFHHLWVLAPAHNPHMPGRGQGHPQTLMSSSAEETKEECRERYNGNLNRWLVLLLFTVVDIYSSNNNQVVQIKRKILVLHRFLFKLQDWKRGTSLTDPLGKICPWWAAVYLNCVPMKFILFKPAGLTLYLKVISPPQNKSSTKRPG